MPKCPDCTAGRMAVLVRGVECEMACGRCGGRATITAEQAEWAEVGQAMRKFRLARNLTLRAEAFRRNLYAAELSRMEQGTVRPVPAKDMPGAVTPELFRKYFV